MELSPKLNTTNFGWSEKCALRDSLCDINKEEMVTLEKEISRLISKNFPNLLDSKLLELFKKYPKPFKTGRRVVLSSYVLGITADTYYAHEADGVHVSGSHYFDVMAYPMKNHETFSIVKEDLGKLDPVDLEQIKSLYSKYLELVYQRDVLLREFDNIKDSIRTIGRLYRVKKEWYEILVRKKYPEEADAVPEPKKTPGKRGPMTKLDDKAKCMIDDLKDVLDL